MNHEMLEHESRRSWYRAMFPRLLHRGMPYLEFGSGWDDIVIRLLQAIDAVVSDEQASAFEVRQVKEKFGTLRFHYGFSQFNDADSGVDVRPFEGQNLTAQKVRALVEDAMVASQRTCERCGAPGKLRERRLWLKVLCARCELNKR